MLSSQIPTKFPIPFASSAGASFINPIPQASQIGVVGGAASLIDGFPPINFVPVNAGGIPPWGRDFNGLFNQITAWTRWQGAGGQVVFDATFAAAIGGYPIGALLQSVSVGNMWVSTTENNLTNPDTTPGAPGWLGVGFITSIQNGSYISGDDTGSADIYVSAPQPAPAAYVKYQRFQVKITNANLTTTPTLNIVGVSGLLGAKAIVHPDGSQPAKNDMTAGMVASFIYDGVKMQLQNTAAAAAGGGIINIQVITASGLYVPTLNTKKALAFATGGGGAGGVALSCGGAGGAGSTAVTLVNVSGPISCTIGAGGVGVQSAPNGSSTGGSGSTTFFGTFAIAGGGQGGQASDLAGTGGVPSVGTMQILGGDGGTAYAGSGFGSGNGGSSFWGGGGSGSSQPEATGSGHAGKAYGSGGGGGDSNPFGGRTGGNGAPGVILVLEF